VVHHAVEKKYILDEFPELIGVISEMELNSLFNFRGIPNELNNQMHLSEFRIIWNQFYAEVKARPSLQSRIPTKEEIFAKVKEIDDKYGHLFYPPIR
jgi:hypothetical protein